MPTSRSTGTVTRGKKKTETKDATPVAHGPQSPTMPPQHEEIARLAYQFWEERGRPDGSSYEDWLRAESHLSSMAS
jgi:hypothetical protein